MSAIIMFYSLALLSVAVIVYVRREKMITLVPAYGRDYKNKDAVLKDFNENKDFKINDISCRYDGKLVSKSQLIGDYDTVKIRYNNLRSIVIFEVD